MKTAKIITVLGLSVIGLAGSTAQACPLRNLFAGARSSRCCTPCPVSESKYTNPGVPDQGEPVPVPEVPAASLDQEGAAIPAAAAYVPGKKNSPKSGAGKAVFVDAKN